MRIYNRVWVVLVFLIFLVNLNGYSQADSGAKKKNVIISNGRPNIPGEIGFDLGLLINSNFPDYAKLRTIHCTYFSPFYKFESFIPNSNFSVLIGLDLGLEKYRFESPVTIERTPDARGRFSNEIVRIDTTLYNAYVKTSKLAVNYLEIPLEFRFRSNKTYPKSSFNISVGGKVGYMFNSHTKYKYKQESYIKNDKHRDKFDLNAFRFGVIGRIGFGNFNAFYYYSLSTLFEKNKGLGGNDSNPMLFGLSLSLF